MFPLVSRAMYEAQRMDGPIGIREDASIAT